MLTSIETRAIQNSILKNDKRVKKITPDNNGREKVKAYVIAECARLKVKPTPEELRVVVLSVMSKWRESCAIFANKG